MTPATEVATGNEGSNIICHRAVLDAFFVMRLWQMSKVTFPLQVWGTQSAAMYASKSGTVTMVPLMAHVCVFSQQTCGPVFSRSFVFRYGLCNLQLWLRLRGRVLSWLRNWQGMDPSELVASQKLHWQMLPMSARTGPMATRKLVCTVDLCYCSLLCQDPSCMTTTVQCMMQLAMQAQQFGCASCHLFCLLPFQQVERS